MCNIIATLVQQLL